ASVLGRGYEAVVSKAAHRYVKAGVRKCRCIVVRGTILNRRVGGLGNCVTKCRPNRAVGMAAGYSIVDATVSQCRIHASSVGGDVGQQVDDLITERDVEAAAPCGQIWCNRIFDWHRAREPASGRNGILSDVNSEAPMERL